jgi:hypothetical protein
MLELQERRDVSPVCPHCDQAIGLLWFQSLAGMLGRRYVYFCPSCHRVLGVSHRKGFWMG